ncbi:MAG: LysR substrate-binding domain-containing protein [Motiliproteus sp.]
MSKHVEPDQVLLKMPSLRAVKSFVAAAKYQSFTRAAEALCVTQAAISRQVRELESHLGVELFNRKGRSVELTEAGSVFYDAAYLSFVNIAQSADRVQGKNQLKRTLTICASPAFSGLWLTPRLPDFFSQHPDININVISTDNVLSMEPNVRPDIFIIKNSVTLKGYQAIPLFYDRIYPVCSPQYLEQHGPIDSLEQMAEKHTLLNLSPYGRSQVAEHIDWEVWFNFHGINLESIAQHQHRFNANDYNMLIKMALSHQGITLGWHHLVTPLIEEGALLRPVADELILKSVKHYLSYKNELQSVPEFQLLKQWLLEQLTEEEHSGAEEQKG